MKITKGQALDFASDITNCSEAKELPGMQLDIEAKIDTSDNTLRLQMAGWLNKDDIKSLRRILKAVLDTLP